jgi:ribosomal-protein-alanine N-acetyltransferase
MSDIRSLLEKDLSSLAFLEAACFSPGWSDTQLSKQLSHPRALSLGFFSPEMSGFALISTVLDEAELLQIAVDPGHRGEGISINLLNAAVVYLRQRGIIRLMLEVRQSNLPAISLYRRFGFVEEGIRKAYYPPLIKGGLREDALLFSYSC